MANEGGPVILNLRSERAVVSPEKRTLDILVEISGAEAPDVERASVPRVLAIAVDTSGSMKGIKLSTAKQFCQRALAKTSAPHKLIIVAFADQARVVFNPDDDPVTFQQQLKAMEADGPTALADGWRTAKLELGTFAGGDGAIAKRILLITDGECNVGEKSPDVLAAWCARAAEEEHIATSTVGVGSGFNEELLSRMAGPPRATSGSPTSWSSTRSWMPSSATCPAPSWPRRGSGSTYRRRSPSRSA